MKYIKCRLTAMRKFVSSNYDRNKKIFYLIFFVFLLSAIPVYKQGITCNDELQARLWGMKGFGEFYRHYTKVYITTGGGRALSAILNPIYMYLGFGSNGSGSFRIVQILSIFGDAAMFSVFLNKLFHKKGFAVACGLSVVVFLPVTFELTAPNAFNTFFNIPVALLFLSFILYINYLDDNKKCELGLSILLLFLTLLSYEAFIMFVPLYWGICIKKKERRDKKQLIIKCLYPTLAALLFLILYVITGIVFRSQYAGIRIRNVSFGDSLAIIVQLIKSSIPGYFFFSAKYRYLAHIYFGLTLENYIRIIFVCVFFGLTIYAVMKQCKDNISNTGIFWRTLGVGALCIVLPAIPLSLAESYQGRLNSYDVLAQPTSYFCYFATTFVCWWVIWQLVQKLQSMPFVALTAVILSLYLFPVQAMNDMFAEQQSKDFKRLLALESLYSTELSGNWGGQNYIVQISFRRRMDWLYTILIGMNLRSIKNVILK